MSGCVNDPWHPTPRGGVVGPHEAIEGKAVEGEEEARDVGGGLVIGPAVDQSAHAEAAED